MLTIPQTERDLKVYQEYTERANGVHACEVERRPRNRKVPSLHPGRVFQLEDFYWPTHQA